MPREPTLEEVIKAREAAQAELLKVFARETGADPDTIMGPFLALREEDRSIVFQAMWASLPFLARRATRIQNIAPELADAIVRASLARINSPDRAGVVKRGVLVRLPAPLNAAAHILDLARKGAFHADVALHITPEAASDAAIAKAAGIDAAGAAKQIERIRYELASDVAELAGRIADALKLDRILDLSTIDPKDEPEEDSASDPLGFIDADPEKESILRGYDAIIAGAMGESGGMLAWDAALASVAEECGARSEAAKVRKRAKERWAERNSITAAELWRMWLDPTAGYLGMRFLTLLAVAAWTRKRPTLAKRFQALTAPMFVVSDLAELGASERTMEAGNGRIIAMRGELVYPTDLTLTTIEGIERTQVPTEALAKITGNNHFWSVLHWIVRTVRDQEAAQVPDPHIIRVEGGNDGLRRALGLAKREAGQAIRDVLNALHMLSNASNPGQGRFLTLTESKVRSGPSGGRPTSVLAIEVQLLLRPHAAKRLGISVPLWDLPIFDPSLIPRIGDRRTYGRQNNAVQTLSLALHRQRESIALDGTFELTKRMWNEHAARYGLYHRSHASLQDRLFVELTQSAPPAPPAQGELVYEDPPRPRREPGTEPMLVRVAPDRYRLGDSFAPEWRHFIEQGQITIAQSRRGKASARQKARTLERIARPRRGRRDDESDR